ncbi:MAG TPA: fibronectin type III domain-containing protein [Sporichthya sp.]|nr:fibronectin type III domain-containing protein [Sporichthya sp.]
MSIAFGLLAGGAGLVAAQTAQDPSAVVLVFDVSDSILGSDDGTNVEFAAALDDIADRVGTIATDLTAGNATVSFVAFGRKAIPYPAGCQRLQLHDDPAAVSKFEDCLRRTAAEYRAGPRAPVKNHINTAGTDHPAALREAAALLPAAGSRSAIVFFTDGQNDPPGTNRDHENVVAVVTPTFAGRTPLAILPVGLGAGAGAFETELQAIYDAFFRDMAPCEGRASFSWPQVVFPSASEAGAAVALALQEVTCSFTVAPTPTPEPSPTAPPPNAPQGVQVLAGNQSLTIQWLPPSTGVVVDYVVHCRPATGGDWIESSEGVSTTTETVIEGLQPGVAYDCEVAASDGATTGPFAPALASTVVLGIPGVPGQPRVEPLDGAARLTVDPVSSGAPVEQYDYECTSAAGRTVLGTGPQPNVVVTGLTNGETFQCVAYTENSIGRSGPSIASASFAACSGLFACNPWALYVASGGAIVAILAGLLIVARVYRRRNRVWVTAQVDGGPNRPIGWGPRLGVALDQDEDGWFAALRPLDGAPIRVRYQGKNRFLVQSSAGVRDVHQGDPASVREGSGETHQLTLRLYRQPPREATPPARQKPPDPETGSALGARLDGRDEGSAPADTAATPEDAT